MTTFSIQYKGALRTEAVHLGSGEVIITDAPIDNKGKGEAFSPTDLLATSLATCMITVMGIHAKTNSLPFKGVRANVVKTMNSLPRRVKAVEVNISVKGDELNDTQREELEQIAKNCPVAKSLSSDLDQIVTILFY